MRRLAHALILSAVLGCEEPFSYSGPPTVPVASVTIAPDSLVIIVGQQGRFTATPRDSTGAAVGGRSVTWNSTDTGVATVTATGAIVGRGGGTAGIVATVEGKADTARAIVRPLVWVALSAGQYHTCGLTNGGSVHCWGLNISGQIGIGPGGFRQTTPARVSSTLLFSRVAVGGSHSCAVAAADSTAHCWGSNAFIQLGRIAGATNVPGPVVGNARWVGVTGGAFHTCALAADSTAYCWGSSNEGQVGDSLPPATQPVPTLVAGGLRYRAVRAGLYHTCAVSKAAEAWCWGWNNRGQLGDSSLAAIRAFPVPVGGITAVTAVAPGQYHSCAIASLEVVCWGDNQRGQLGQGAIDSLSRAPLAVPGVDPIALVSGSDHTCALQTDSTAVCWGGNDEGQLGDGFQLDKPTPVPVTGGRKFVALATGFQHTCGLTAAGVAYCWGRGTEGQLGHGNTASFPTPQLVDTPQP